MKVQVASTGIALRILNLGIMWVANATPRPLYLQERDPVPVVQEAGWTALLVWTGVRKRKITCPHRGLNPELYS